MRGFALGNIPLKKNHPCYVSLNLSRKKFKKGHKVSTFDTSNINSSVINKEIIHI